MKKYRFTQYISKYAPVGDEYKFVELSVDSKLDLDAIINMIGYLVEGAEGKTVKFGVTEIVEEDRDE